MLDHSDNLGRHVGFFVSTVRPMRIKENRTIPRNSSESPAFVVFLSLISYNQFCSQSEYQMKLYESNHLVATVPMNKNFSPDKR